MTLQHSNENHRIPAVSIKTATPYLDYTTHNVKTSKTSSLFEHPSFCVSPRETTGSLGLQLCPACSTGRATAPRRSSLHAPGSLLTPTCGQSPQPQSAPGEPTRKGAQPCSLSALAALEETRHHVLHITFILLPPGNGRLLSLSSPAKRCSSSITNIWVSRRSQATSP